MSAWCVLLAAGRGVRSGLEENKVFFRWRGRSVLSRCIDALAAAGAYEGIVLVLAASDLPRYEELTRAEGAHPLVKKVVTGGSTRRESGFNGLRAVPEGTDFVSVHDAARPFVTPEIVRATLADAAKYGSGVISTPVTDTIKRVDPATGAVTTLERSKLRAVQTPQSFNYAMLMEAHMRANRENIPATDDAMLFERVYGSVHLSEAPGAEQNVKLTLPKDFAALRGPSLRMGSGYDAHRLKEGRRLVLCGVDVPHDRGLDGHSDADVAVHALMDAILGALGEGDIGRHFPDSDERYRGISSMLLLAQVMELARERGFQVCNADVTIVAQRPKLAPYIPQMRQNIAEALGVELDCANVKATTTERMGFEGEEIGISAQAVTLLECVSKRMDVQIREDQVAIQGDFPQACRGKSREINAEVQSKMPRGLKPRRGFKVGL